MLEPKKKRNKLFKVSVDEISIVDRGAIGLPFVVTKRDGEKEDLLDLLGRIQDGIDDLRKRDENLYYLWKKFPGQFDHTFEDDATMGGALTITLKKGSGFASAPSRMSPDAGPSGETATHKFNFETSRWEPKRSHLNRG